MSAGRTPLVVLGAGPAGLGAAWRLAKRGCFQVTVVEQNHVIGGNAGSFELDGLRVDYGSHRLHPACAPEILADIRGMLGADLLDRPRHGRIRLRGRWVHFPLKPVDLTLHLPLAFVLGVGRDALFKNRTSPAEETFVSVLEKGLGRTICRDFYFPYARKIWGVAPESLDAEQARRRVSAGSIGKMIRKVLNAVPGFKPKGAGRFFYPKRGYGAIVEAYHRAAVEAGADVQLQTTVDGLELEQDRATAVRVRRAAGEERLPARQVLSTIPVTALARLASPAAPGDVLESAAALKFRAMLLVYLVLETDQFTEYDAHYFPDPDVGITRLSEPKNYGLAELPGLTVLCAELPCFPEDKVWSADDAQLGRLVTEALNAADLPVRARVRHVAVRRLRQAYPVYLRQFRGHFQRLDSWLGELDGVLTFGRQGLFAHDNTHHALAMAYAAEQCLDAGGNLNRALWAEHRREFEHHVVED